MTKEVWITGIGIVSSLGEGLDAHWDALNEKRVNIDEQAFRALHRSSAGAGVL